MAEMSFEKYLCIQLPIVDKEFCLLADCSPDRALIMCYGGVGLFNIFEYFALIFFFLALITLATNVWRAKSVAGISGKSQLMMFAAICFRTDSDAYEGFHIPVWFQVVEIASIIVSLFTLYLVFVKFRSTRDQANDTFLSEMFLLPAIIFHHELYAYNLGSRLGLFAVLAQMYMIYRTRETSLFDGAYMWLAGLSIFLLSTHNMYRTQVGPGMRDSYMFASFACAFIFFSLIFVVMRARRHARDAANDVAGPLPIKAVLNDLPTKGDDLNYA